MSDDFELVRGSGNVFRDFGDPDADLEQARALLAARIIRTLDERKLSTREAERLTGVAHTEFSRIRNAKLERFTWNPSTASRRGAAVRSWACSKNTHHARGRHARPIRLVGVGVRGSASAVAALAAAASLHTIRHSAATGRPISAVVTKKRG